MGRCKRVLSEWLCKYGAIDEKDKELYEYAISVWMITALPLATVLIIGSVMGMILQGILIMISFLSIRKYSGGFHTKRARTCFVLSVVVITFCIYLAGCYRPSTLLHVITLISIVGLMLLSPVDSENRKLEFVEQGRYRIAARRITSFWGIIYVALCMNAQEEYAMCISLGIIMAAGLQWLSLSQKTICNIKSL